MCSINNVCQALKGFLEDSGKLNLSIIKGAKVLTWVPISSAEEVWTGIPESEYFDCHRVYHWDLRGRLKKKTKTNHLTSLRLTFYCYSAGYTSYGGPGNLRLCALFFCEDLRQSTAPQKSAAKICVQGEMLAPGRPNFQSGSNPNPEAGGGPRAEGGGEMGADAPGWARTPAGCN